MTISMPARFSVPRLIANLPCVSYTVPFTDIAHVKIEHYLQDGATKFHVLGWDCEPAKRSISCRNLHRGNITHPAGADSTQLCSVR